VAEIKFQQEKFYNIQTELPALFQAHHTEVDTHNHDIQLKPDYYGYLKLEAAGALRILTARDSGKLVGYFFALVWPSLHFTQEISAVSDIFYLSPECRRGMAGLKLLKEAEKMLTSMGVTRCYLVTKEGSNANIVVERLGYNLVEHIYFKALDHE
jgi:hypothetical protein